MAHVVVVGGPPGAGKTYYVHQRMKEGDVVLDVDAIVAALTGRPWYDFTPEQLRLALDVREFLLLRLRYPTDVWTAWVITSAASASARGSIVEQCGAQETIMLLEPVAICMNRIRSDKRRAGTLSRWDLVVNQWWMDYEAIEGETVCVGSPGRGRPISGDPDV